MSELKTPYPPSPPDVPEGLTDYADSFARQQNRVLTGLFIFLIFYFAMIVLFAMLGVWCLLTLSGPLVPLKIVGLVLSTTFFLFHVKGFFKSRPVNREMYDEITEDEHPVLFDFLHQLCEELGAPFPDRVFTCPDVIAEYTARTSLINLFVEPKRELLIGMGLVNCTNLSEFKAILAHEFGHFCHLGRAKSYCAVVQNIVFDLIEGEDFFDRFLKRCKHNPETDSPGFQLKMLLWPVVYPVSWILEAGHTVLWLILKSVALPGRGMVWEQEYHADLVAVSAAGSDAVTHGLVRGRFGMLCFNQTVDDLVTLVENHDLYTNDLYFHQDRAAAIVRWKLQAPDLGLPPALPEPTSGESIRVFDSEDDYEDENTPPMWRRHPFSTYREENAKEHFVPAVMDHRSPWILFENAAELKERMTYAFYRVVFHIRKNADLTDAHTIQGYIDQAYPEITQTPPGQPFPERILDSGEVPIPIAIESISLVPVEEPIPVVKVPEPVAVALPLPVAVPVPVPAELPVPIAVPAAPVVDELKGETVFDEVIRVIEGDIPLAGIDTDAPPVAVSAPMAQVPQMPTILDVPMADSVVAEAHPAEPVGVAAPEPAMATALDLEPIPPAVSEPVIASELAEARDEADSAPEPEPALSQPLISSTLAKPEETPSSSAFTETISQPAVGTAEKAEIPVPLATTTTEHAPYAVAEAASLDASETTRDREHSTVETSVHLTTRVLPPPAHRTAAIKISPLGFEDEPAPATAAPAPVEATYAVEAAQEELPTLEEVAAPVVEARTPDVGDLQPEMEPGSPSETPPVDAESAKPGPEAAIAPVVEAEPTTTTVAFGSSAVSKGDAIPVGSSSHTDGPESEVFALDEVEPVPSTAGAILSLEAEDSATRKAEVAEANKPTTLPKPPTPRPMVKIGFSGLSPVADTQPDTGATPAPRSGFGSLATPKPDAGATPVPRPSFGSGVMPALGITKPAETVIPAAGRRPTLRITYVKPGEKSPLAK